MATLKIDIVIDDKGSVTVGNMTKNFGAMDKAARTADSAISGIHTSLNKIAGIVGGAFAITSLIAFGKNALETMDKLDEMSQKVGVNTDTLQVFGHMATLAGTDLDGVSRALGIMSKNLLTAEMKGEDANKALRSLGISARDSNGALKSSDQILVEVANKFKNMKDGVEKTAISMMLFGKSGKDMVPLLNQGGQGIEEVRKQLESLGILMSKDAIQAAGELNDRLETLGLMTKGLAMRIMGEATPALDTLVKFFIQGAEKSGQLAETGDNLGKSLGKAFMDAAGYTYQFSMLLDRVGGTLTAIGTIGTLGLSQSMKDLNKMFEERYKTSHKELLTLTMMNEGYKLASKEQLQWLDYATAEDVGLTRVATDVGDILYFVKEVGKAKKKTAGTPMFNTGDDKKAAQELESIRKKMADDIAKNTLSEIEQIERTAAEYRKKGISDVETEKWASSEINKINMKLAMDIAKTTAQTEERRRQEWEKSSDEYSKIVSEEADFASTENERAINKIISDENRKLGKLYELYAEDKINFQQLEDTKTKIEENSAAARLEKTTENAKKIADINYSSIQGIRGMETQAYNYKIWQIDAEAAKREKDGGDAILIAQWVKNEQIKAFIELGQKGESVSMGIRAAFAQMYQDQMTWGKASYDMTIATFTNMKSGVSSILLDGIKGEMSSFEDYLDTYYNLMLKKFTDILADMVVNWGMAQALMAANSYLGTSFNIPGMQIPGAGGTGNTLMQGAAGYGAYSMLGGSGGASLATLTTAEGLMGAGVSGSALGISAAEEGLLAAGYSAADIAAGTSSGAGIFGFGGMTSGLMESLAALGPWGITAMAGGLGLGALGLTGNLNDVFGSIGDAASSVVDTVSDVISDVGDWFSGWEKGGAFSHGSPIPFGKGDVFSKSTFFPMAQGNVGLLGENGDEAIMPLSRGRDGKLGVRSGGSGDTEPLQLQIIIELDSGVIADKLVSISRRGRAVVHVRGIAR